MPTTDGAGIPQLDQHGFLLDPSNPASGLVGTTLSGLPVWSAYQTAAHLARSGNTWVSYTSGMSVSYSFGVGVTLPAGYEAFSSPEAQAGALRAMQLYAEVCNLTFSEAADPAAADITYIFGVGSTNGGGWANFPSSGGGYVQVGHVSWETTMLPGTYSLNLLLHELGHGVGLDHPGEYNGDTAVYGDADHFNDSAQYTNMSYWGESYTGGSFSELSTLGLHDMLAVQMEYGINWSTRAGDTVYGFHSTAGSQSYDFAFDSTMGFCIWDGGGNDTLDFSGFKGGTVLDLRQGSFSSTGLETYSVSVAYNAVIENAVGGAGNDKIHGNEVANRLTGGKGDDLILGGSDTVAAVSNPRDFVGIGLNRDPLTNNQYLQVSGVTAFSGSAFTFETMVKLDRLPASTAELASYNVSGNDNQFILEAATSGAINITIANRATYYTDVSAERLVDGNPHRVSVTWEKATGAVGLYIDGTLAHSGIYTAAIGATINAGGTLVIGQEQDSVGGGFDPDQILQGVVGDIRIFNDLRTAPEIAGNAFCTLTGSEQGLAHNWQVEAGDTATITDVAVANPAVDLTSLMPAGTFTASQSSSYNSSSGAARILDNDNASFNHTLNGGNEWVLLDFNQPLAVDHIQIVNRPTWGSRLNGSTVSLLDANGSVIYTSAAITGATDGGVITIMLPSEMTAKAVRINQTTNFLHIAELNVFGQAPAGVIVPPELINTDLTIFNGAIAVSTAAAPVPPDNDTLYGDGGNDTLIGGVGNDTLWGGSQDGSEIAQDFVGLRLNSGATTGEYLDITSALSGAAMNQFTLEMLIKMEGSSSGYAIATLSPGYAIELEAVNGNLQLTVAGAVYNSGYKVDQLADGSAHRLSVSWNSAGGAVSFYVDGALVNSGVVAAGSTVNDFGRLVIGQDQNSSGTGFAANRDLHGVVGDIRLFNDVRTAQEIADNAFTTLSATTQGLVHNWQAQAGNTTAVTDVVPLAAVVNLTDVTPGIFAASQSSVYSGSYVAGNILDNSNSSSNHTLNSANEWLRLDFQQPLAITRVELINRASNGSRLNGATVSVLDSLGNVVYTSAAISGATDGSLVVITLPSEITASAVRIDQHNQYLHVAEVNVFGHPPAGATNLAIHGGSVVHAMLDDDTLIGGLGGDSLIGGAGTDFASYETATAGVSVNLFTPGLNTGEAAGDTYVSIEGVIGSSLVDYLGGDNGANELRGMGGNDGLWGVGGNDTLIGGEGSDTLNGGLGSDSLDGGNGIDFASYVNSTSGITVSLLSAGSNTGEAVGDVFLSIEGVIGSQWADVIGGDASANELRGMNGNDGLWGVGGNDTLVGGEGNDVLYGGTGGDRLDGGNGFDLASYINAAAGINADLSAPGVNTGEAAGDVYISIEGVVGSNFADIIGGTVNADELHGKGGSDGLWGAAGNDTLLGGEGDDLLYGGAGGDRLDGGNGFDLASYITSTIGISADLSAPGVNTGEAAGDSYISIEGLIGTNLADLMGGTVNADELRGMGGNDGLWGAGGNDTLVGGEGSDKLFGGAGSDLLSGGAGQDRFVFDTAIASAGIDAISDFSVVDDTILISHAVFANAVGDGSGVLLASNFVVGSAASSADQHLVYNSATGALLYDADGNGAIAAVQFATLSTGLALTNADFRIL